MCSTTLKALTFDLFGTILDLEGSLTPVIQHFLIGHGSSLDPKMLWRELRTRQRIEQYQDNLLMLGHSGYLGAVRRAFRYVLNLYSIPFTDEEVQGFVESWKQLSPFEDVLEGMNKLKGCYQLAVLSNGENWFLRHLLNERVRFDFDEVFSVERVGVFKPHPAVYRACARMLGREPNELMMVSSNTFDVMGARACGFKAAWVKRQDLPYEESPFRPTLVVRDLLELADSLLRKGH